MSLDIGKPAVDGTAIALERREFESGSEERRARLDASVYAASALSLFAALIHFWATPEHLEEWWAYGVFFLTVAIAQGIFGVMLLRWPGQLLAFAGIWGNLSVVLMYMLSRTSGIPIGPHAGVAEEAGVLDMASTVSEVAIIVLLVSFLRGSHRSFAVNALFLLGLALWFLRFAGIIS